MPVESDVRLGLGVIIFLLNSSTSSVKCPYRQELQDFIAQLHL